MKLLMVIFDVAFSFSAFNSTASISKLQFDYPVFRLMTHLGIECILEFVTNFHKISTLS